MLSDQEIQTRLQERLGERVSVAIWRERRVMATLSGKDLLKPTLAWLKSELGFYHVSTITGLDSGENLEVLYHLHDGRAELTLRIAVPKSDPHISTVTDIVPGAILYERELQDMFGFVVDGLPDPRRYVLPEDWPDGVYPLRKDFKYKNETTG